MTLQAHFEMLFNESMTHTATSGADDAKIFNYLWPSW